MDYIAVASPRFYEKYFRDGVSPETLAKAPYILFDRKDTLPEKWMMLQSGQSTIASTHMMPSYEGYLSCCLNGTAWGMMPSITVDRLVEEGKLVDLHPGIVVKVSLHWQSSTQSSEILRRLGDLVVDEAKKHLLPDTYRLEM